jgi:hypothetical protein
MRKAALSLLIGLILHCVAVPQSEKHTVESAAWLAGCWQGEVRGKQVTEQWIKPAGGAMLGMAWTISNNKMASHEFLQIRRKDDGQTYYIALPSGQQEASFKLIKSGPQELIFENPEHDFPQRIIYRLAGDGSLKARIEGKENGKEKGFDYSFKRSKCE